MLDPSQLDTVAAAFVTLGGFHRAAPDETALAAFWELLEDWPLPDTAAAASSPTEWPATTSTRPATSAGNPVPLVPSSTARSEASALATSRGWATAVSRIVSASEAVLWATRSIPVTSLAWPSSPATPGTSSHAVSIPGDWAP